MSWPLVSINEFCKTSSGGTPSRKQPEYYDGDIPWIKSGDLREKTVDKATEFISELAVQNSSAKIVPKGAILLAMYGATVGRMAMLGIDAATNQAVCSIIPDKERAFPKYVYYALLAKVPEFLRNAVGGAQPNISQGMVKDTKIVLPPLPEQKRIAAILDKADAIRRKRQQAIQLADEFLRSVFLDMFGDPVTNPKGWETKTIEQLISDEKNALKRGPFGGTLKKEIFVETGYLVYEQYHALNNDFSFQRYFVDENIYQELKAFEVKPKDIIVSCSGVNLGKLAEVPSGAPKGIINQALMKITLNQDFMVNELFIDIFSYPSFKKAFYGDFRGAAIPNFPPMSTFKEFRFIAPPINLQWKYMNIRTKLLAQIRRSEKMDDLMLFESLSQKAFQGEL